MVRVVGVVWSFFAVATGLVRDGRSARTRSVLSRRRAISDFSKPGVVVVATESEKPPSGGGVVAVVSTNGLERTVRFWRYALPVVGGYLAQKARLTVREAVLGDCLSEAECEVLWDATHVWGAREMRSAVDELGGFFTKTGQLVASRNDLFPKQYGVALSGLTDLVDPLDASIVRRVVATEVLAPINATFDEVFASFDDAPLGAASVAQVHRARLTAAYGGLDVAVKVQRPNVEAKLLNDVAQLKALAKPLRGVTPVDYYLVLSELEKQLAGEVDFVAEAAAMERVSRTLSTDADTGAPRAPPLRVPTVVSALSSRRVLVMEFLDGEPLSRVAKRLELLESASSSKNNNTTARRTTTTTFQKRQLGTALLGALTEAFGRCVLDDGFFHADPHPGNLLILKDGTIGLIDFGQVKQISGMTRATLARLMIALANRTKSSEGSSAGTPAELSAISALGLELGVVLAEGAPAEGPAAVAMWIFDDATETLPGGFEQNELSPRSPATALTSFPQDLVLVARSSVLIKGIAAALGLRWSLASEWAPIGARALERARAPPVDTRIRFRSVLRLAKNWAASKARTAAFTLLRRTRRQPTDSIPQ